MNDAIADLENAIDAFELVMEPGNKTPKPTATDSNSTVRKISSSDTSVDFTLESYPDGTVTYAVYYGNSGGSSIAGMTATLVGDTLTLSAED